MRRDHMRVAGIISFCIILLLVITACAGNQAADSPATESTATESTDAATAATDDEDAPATPDETDDTSTDDEDTPAARDEEDDGEDEAPPTPADDTAAADEEGDTDDDGRERNEPGGFAFTPIEGWDAQSLELFDGGATILMPNDTDMENPEAGINIFAGPIESASLFLGDIEEDAPIEEWFAVFASDVESDGNATLSEPEQIEIDGVEGLMADVSSKEEDLGEMQGRVVIARVDDERLFQMIGFGTVDHWDAEMFDTVLASITFFEPVLPAEPPAPELDMEELMPGETDVVTPSDAITPTLQP